MIRTWETGLSNDLCEEGHEIKVIGSYEDGQVEIDKIINHRGYDILWMLSETYIKLLSRELATIEAQNEENAKYDDSAYDEAVDDGLVRNSFAECSRAAG